MTTHSNAALDPAPIALLAGGGSRRFGSDKARVPYHGRALIEHNLRALTFGGHDVFVVGPPRDTYRDLGLACLPDAQPDGGPMGGLLTALRFRLDQRGPGSLGVAACDFVLGSGNLPGLLARVLDSERQTRPGLLSCVPMIDDRHQPVLAAYHTDALPHLQAAFDIPQRSLTRWLHALPQGSVESTSSAYPVPSFNTPDEFRRASALADAWADYEGVIDDPDTLRGVVLSPDDTPA